MLMSAGSGATGATGASAGPIELGVRFFLKDEFSAPVQRMQAGIKGLKGEFTAFQDNLRSARALSTSIAAGGMAMLFGMSQAVQEGAEFLFMLKSVEAITQGTVTQMEALRDVAIEVGRTTIFSPKDIAGGMRFMAMAGQSAETISRTIGPATNLAGATMTHLEGKMGAADILTNALKAFGWEDARSGQMADVLTMAANSANVTLTDLGNSIRYVAATSRNLRIPVEETTGFLMSLGNAGIQASMAGVATENMYRYLAMSLSKFPTKRAEAAWRSMGINKSQLTDSMGNLLPVYEILGMIKGKLASMGSVEQQNILRDIFGVRGLRAAATLINNLDEAVGFINKLKDPSTAGTAAEKMALMMDTLYGSLQRVSDSWMGFKIAFTEAIEGPLRMWLDGLSDMISKAEKFLRTPFGKFTVTFISGLTIAVVLVNTLRAAVAGLAYAFRTLNVSVASMNASVAGAWRYMAGNMGAYTAPGIAAMRAATANRVIIKDRTPLTSKGRYAMLSIGVQPPMRQAPVGNAYGIKEGMMHSRTGAPLIPLGNAYRDTSTNKLVSPRDATPQRESIRTGNTVVPVGKMYRDVVTGKMVSPKDTTHSWASRPTYMWGPTSPYIRPNTRITPLAKPPTPIRPVITGMYRPPMPAPTSVLPLAVGVSRIARVGGLLATVGRGFMGLVGGPVGLGIIAASVGLPYLIDAMSNNTKAVDSNTQAIQDANALATSSEYYAMISNYKVADVVTAISKNLEKMLTDRKIDMNKITEILQSQDINKLGELLGSAMIGSNNPLVIEPN